VTMLDRYGSEEQKAMIEGSITGKYRITFGLTSRTWFGCNPYGNRAQPATRDNVKGWIINGEKMWTTGMHVRPTARCSPAPPAMTATRAASPVSWCRPRVRV